jgi:hypothetical protein
MSRASEAVRVREPVGAEEVDPDHIYCCNNKEAICGADLSRYDLDCVGDCEDRPICPLCAVLSESHDWVCRFCGEGWFI